jgi:hypothetical protein
MVSARPPPLFSSPAATHLLPPGPAQSAIATLVCFLYYRTCPIRLSLTDRWAHPVSEPGVVIRTCPFSLLVHFFHFKTCPIRPHRPQAAARALGLARPLGPADRASVAPCLIAACHSKKCKLQKPPSPSSSSHHRNTSTVAAGLASPCPGCLILPMRDPFLPPLHRSSYPLQPEL